MRVLITGASSGIGKSIAKVYSDKGYDLVLVGRNRDKLESVKKEFTTNVDICSMDLRNIDNCYQLFEQYQDIDIFINNAGFGVFGEFTCTDIDTELSMIDTNIKAMHVLLKLYLGRMEKRGSGSILTVASIAGFMPGPLMATYYASKNYVVKLNEAIREELRRKKSNIYIGILCPGPVRTNFDNVANVKFSLPGMDSDVVARYAVKGMEKHKFYIIRGFKIRILRYFSKIFPINLMVRMVYRSQKKKDSV